MFSIPYSSIASPDRKVLSFILPEALKRFWTFHMYHAILSVNIHGGIFAVVQVTWIAADIIFGINADI